MIALVWLCDRPMVVWVADQPTIHFLASRASALPLSAQLHVAPLGGDQQLQRQDGTFGSGWTNPGQESEVLARGPKAIPLSHRRPQATEARRPLSERRAAVNRRTTSARSQHFKNPDRLLPSRSTHAAGTRQVPQGSLALKRARVVREGAWPGKQRKG